jgi:quercetin dioxygenase-like cupin family protein
MLDVIHQTAGRPSTVQSGTFTGDVRRDAIRDLDPEGPAIGNVFFAPGARTYWHTHDAGQLLTAVVGSGWVVDEDGAVKLNAGDSVWVPAGVRHWHGASAEQFLVHTSFSTAQSSEWLEEVTDEEFAAAGR